jgi:hypothetical protein
MLFSSIESYTMSHTTEYVMGTPISGSNVSMDVIHVHLLNISSAALAGRQPTEALHRSNEVTTIDCRLPSDDWIAQSRSRFSRS